MNYTTNKNKGLFSVLTASSVGTLIEWYDFYIFGSLATVISAQFFPNENPTLALLSTLATFAAGFVVRPFGAVFFWKNRGFSREKIYVFSYPSTNGIIHLFNGVYTEL
jgi:hypothetical protein